MPLWDNGTPTALRAVPLPASRFDSGQRRLIKMKFKIYEIVALVLIDAYILNYIIDWFFDYNIIYNIVSLFVESYTVTHAYILFFINLAVLILVVYVLILLFNRFVKRK